MYNFPIALQLYSVRDDMEADFAGTLKKVKSFGYDGVEFAGLFDHTADEVKKMCADAGVTPISAHVPYDELKKGDETFKTYAEIGCKYIVIPWINAEYLAGGLGGGRHAIQRFVIHVVHSDDHVEAVEIRFAHLPRTVRQRIAAA